jgi:hypothetical protein
MNPSNAEVDGATFLAAGSYCCRSTMPVAMPSLDTQINDACLNLEVLTSTA